MAEQPQNAHDPDQPSSFVQIDLEPEDDDFVTQSAEPESRSTQNGTTEEKQRPESGSSSSETAVEMESEGSDKEKIDHNNEPINRPAKPVIFKTHPPAKHLERKFDLDGPITFHRILTVLYTVGVTTGLTYLMTYLWTPRDDAREGVEWIKYLGVILLVSLPGQICVFLGAMWFKYNNKLDDVEPIPHNVSFRIVSRGLQQECVMETVRACREAMRRNPLFPYIIEITTDAGTFQAPDDDDVVHLQVPLAYQTPNGAKFKARALHYGCTHTNIPPNTWIVHLDEETRPKDSAIKGIAAMIEKAERTGRTNTLGQGMMMYNRSFKNHPLLTMADMHRTGQDVGHYSLQHHLGVTVFGFHGSYIVCRQDWEARIGFDLGPTGSITEDAWWVLLAMKDGYRTVWVDGFMDEQSNESVGDFLKQRRRWLYGLLKVVTFNPAPWYWRICIGWIVYTAALVPILLPLQLSYAILLWVFNIQFPLYFSIPCAFVITMQYYIYVCGWIINLRENSNITWWKIPFWTFILLLMVPVFTLMEVVSFVMTYFAGFTKSGRGFHVVQKSVT